MTEAAQRRRAEKSLARSKRQERIINQQKRDLKTTHSRRFAEGSAAMMGAVHDALDDADLSMWISQRLLARRKRLPPFHLSEEKQAMVRVEVADLLKRCGIKHINVEDLPL